MHLEDIAVENIYVLNVGVASFIDQIGPDKIKVEDFKTPFSPFKLF